MTDLPPLSSRPPRGDGLPSLDARPERGDGLPPLAPRDASGGGALPPLGGGSRRRGAGLRGEDPASTPRPVGDLAAARRRRRAALGAVALVAAGAVGGLTAVSVYHPERDGAVAQSTAPSSTAPTPVPVPPVTPTAGTTDLQAAVARVTPSVVQIRTPGGQGSGVIVAPKNLIITNEHVVRGSDRVVVVTSDGRAQAGQVLVHDPAQDLAIVRPSSAVPGGVALADETVNPVRVGDEVFAVGSPFGLQNTVTAGIVSALNRRGDGGVPMIQTDAPINPGNSGGGLFDIDGRLVGIPTSIRAPITGNVGIGFAVPSSRVAALMDRVP